MVTQDHLLPTWRRHDPWTSAASGHIIDESGHRATLMEICMEAVKSHPGLTAGEIGEATGLGHQRVWRRLSDLKNVGKVEQRGARIWQGRKQVLWYPVTGQLKLW